jgi:hypothetical protein
LFLGPIEAGQGREIRGLANIARWSGCGVLKNRFRFPNGALEKAISQWLSRSFVAS